MCSDFFNYYFFNSFWGVIKECCSRGFENQFLFTDMTTVVTGPYGSTTGFWKKSENPRGDAVHEAAVLLAAQFIVTRAFVHLFSFDFPRLFPALMELAHLY